MPDIGDYRTVTAAAEQAASQGDYARAASLLLEAAALQEAAKGPTDPDLASTYNNVAVASEMTGDLVNAERHFRRAHAIALRAYGATHPIVALSLSNLREFCAAHGLPLDAEPDVARTPPRQPAPPGPTAPAAPSPAAATSPRRVPRGALAGLGVAAVLALAAGWATLGAGRLWHTPATTEQASQVTPAATPDPLLPAAPADPSAIAPTSAPESTLVVTNTTRPEDAPPTPVGTTATKDTEVVATDADAPSDLRVVSAQVCTALTTGNGSWACDRPEGAVDAGRFAYYTRLASATSRRIQHRWYQGETLRQTVTLPIAANPAGYRTFSRQTVSQGTWRVELSTEDGTLLDETTFEVR